MAAKMLAAYYDHSCDSRTLFADLQIAGDPSFEQHLNKYAVLYLDMSAFIGNIKDGSIVDRIKEKLKADIMAELKVDRDAKAAIHQIKERNHPQKVAEYTGDILLVGINYDRDTKQHTCRIETVHA